MKTKRHNGFVAGGAILMLLIVIAIGIMIYYMDIMWMGGDGQMFRNQQVQDENQPWKNESLIKGPNQSITMVPKNSNTPIISSSLVLSGPVSMKDQERGKINFTINPDGIIRGNWQCRYSYTHAAYEITADFTGNTDPTQNASGDASKMLLVAKGTFTQKTTNLDSGEITQSKGTVYVNGWLSHDFKLSGTLSTTTDKKWHADYEFLAD